MKAILALEDGTLFFGRSFTGDCDAVGEVVFNTSMSGYQEILTDPSYCGQMVTMTYPLIGNYGVNREDVESDRIQVRALLVKEYQEHPSNFRSEKSLADYLMEAGVPGIQGIDTRALTRRPSPQGNPMQKPWWKRPVGRPTWQVWIWPGRSRAGGPCCGNRGGSALWGAG